MDATLVATLAAVATVVGMVYWMFLVRPVAMLDLLGADPEWANDAAIDVSAIRALQIAGAVIVLLVTAATGFAVSFLAGTSGG